MKAEIRIKKITSLILCFLILNIASCGSANPLIGEWEAGGIFRMKFDSIRGRWPDGSCNIREYITDTIQIDGNKFKRVTIDCISKEKSDGYKVSFIFLNNNIVYAFGITWHRIT